MKTSTLPHSWWQVPLAKARKLLSAVKVLTLRTLVPGERAQPAQPCIQSRRAVSTRWLAIYSCPKSRELPVLSMYLLTRSSIVLHFPNSNRQVCISWNIFLIAEEKNGPLFNNYTLFLPCSSGLTPCGAWGRAALCYLQPCQPPFRGSCGREGTEESVSALQITS